MSGALDLVEAVAPFAERDAAEIAERVQRLERLGPHGRLELLVDDVVSPDEQLLTLAVGNYGGARVLKAIEAAREGRLPC